MRKGFTLLSLFVALSLLLTQVPVAAAAPAAPTNISCLGFAADTVVVLWRDNATDETEYRVERRIGSGSWSEVATLPANSGSYQDTGADTSQQNRFYRVRAFKSGDSSFSPYSPICNNRRIATSANFRVFFGLEGTADACPAIDGNDVCLANTSSGGQNIFVQRQLDAHEGSLGAFGRLGFTLDASDVGTLDRAPINIVWCDGGGCANGALNVGISPLLAEMAFNTTTRVGDPAAWIVALHELWHKQQFRYGGLSDPSDRWVIEGQARSIQDKVCIGADRSNCQNFDDIATGFAGYVGEVNGYLGNPNRPITETSYQAVLFWTYLVEKYGTSSPTDTVENGMNFLVEFWKESNANPGQTGIALINKVLTKLGHPERFRDVWKDFAVASYAKDLTATPAKYQYADMAEPGGNYAAVALNINQPLPLSTQIIDTDETVQPWGANYYQVRPDASVPVIDINFTQDSTVPLYYTVLGVKGTNLAYEYNFEGRNLSHTLLNDSYDRVVVIVAGLEGLANYRYSFNGTQPELHILSPTSSNRARVGDPSAPDKFLLQLELVSSDGVPLSGVNLNNFAFQVGSVAVPASNIINKATVQGQQWFVVRAPAQTAAGLYNLQATYGSAFTDTEVNAINYAPRTDADSMIILDRSGSMAGNGKLESAQAAARLYVDSWRTGDRIGVNAFNQAGLEMALTPWTDTPSGGSRQTAFTAINGLTAGGFTAIGDALREGWNELIANGNSSHDWALVLLSDGKEEGPTTETFGAVIDALVNTTGKRPVVHTVAVGPDADRPRMQQAANRTGGTYQFVSIPASPDMRSATAVIPQVQLDLDRRYRAIATEVLGLQQTFTFEGPMNDSTDTEDVVTIPVENGAAEMILTFSYVPGTGVFNVLTLRDPASNAIVPFEVDSRHTVWRVPTPQGGNWTLRIADEIIITDPRSAAAPVLPDYLIHVSLRSDVTMDAYLTTPDEERVPGVPMPIVVSLTDTGPVLGATVVAQIQRPNGSLIFMPLFDDGAHGDGAAADGLYANTFLQTGQHGSYNVLIKASGVSSFSGAFTREKALSFHLEGPEDTDGDGLPDIWETTHGTDPNVPDGTDDPDHDGSPTINEWDRGTDPQDPDTDDGGESDGSDPNPLDPADDNIEPIWGVAYPGDGEVLVKFVLRPAYTAVRFFRSEGIAGPYVFHDEIVGPTSDLYTDTAVVNGTEYCYLLQAKDGAGRLTNSLTPTCATPKADPYPPHGWLQINNGAEATLSTNVQLKLWATDAVDPHHVEPGETLLPPAGSEVSGVSQMRISNLATMADASWEPYATSKAWTLAQTSGLATVFAQFRDGAGNVSDVVEASIFVGVPPICPGGGTSVSAVFVDADTGRFTNHASNCRAAVGMAVYEKVDADIDTQQLFDAAETVLDPGATVELDVTLPTCAAQVDLFRGSLLPSLQNQRYGSRLLAHAHLPGTGFCTRAAPVGSVSGFVAADGLRVANVTVILAAADSAAADGRQGPLARTAGSAVLRTSITDALGRYRFEAVPFGAYVLRVQGETAAGQPLNIGPVNVAVSSDAPEVVNMSVALQAPLAVTLRAALSGRTSALWLWLVVGLVTTLTWAVLYRRADKR